MTLLEEKAGRRDTDSDVRMEDGLRMLARLIARNLSCRRIAGLDADGMHTIATAGSSPTNGPDPFEGLGAESGAQL